MTKYVAMATFLLDLSGCTANMAGYVEALGKDTANVCVTVSSPYGGGAVGRINTPGTKLNASGGQCTMETIK